MLKIEKDNWIKYRFDEIAENISERVEPAVTDLDIYVGLEHLDSGSIHIIRHGHPSDVKGTKLKVYKGDVIFGKRRAYQRKAAVAEFDGICSAHAMVLRANPKIILPELFPFFLHSDIFMNRAIDISEGSLSPTIKWNILARQEFYLPPHDVQKEIIKIFISADIYRSKNEILLKSINVQRESYFLNMLNSLKGEIVELKTLLRPRKEKSAAPHAIQKYVGLENITSGSFECLDFQTSQDVQAQCNLFYEGDLCYSKLRPYLDKAFIASFNGICTTELLVFEKEDNVDFEYLLNHLHSRQFIEYVNQRSFGTKMPRTSLDIMGGYKIKILDKRDEKKLMNEINNFQNIYNNTKKTVASTDKINLLLINKVFDKTL